MAVPVQIWQPLFQSTPFDAAFARDLQRAMATWRGEDYIHLMPKASEEGMWEVTQHGIRFVHRLLRSEALDELLLVHLDEERRLYPPLPLPKEWKNTLPEGLYRSWLGVQPKLVSGRWFLKRPLPLIRDGKVEFRPASIKLAPGPMMPVTAVGEQGGMLTLSWPPPDSLAPAPVSVEMESRSWYGTLKREQRIVDGQQIEIITAEKDPDIEGFNVWFQWPAPFDVLFPFGGSYDLQLHQAKLRNCIEDLGAGKQEAALREAESWVSRLTGEGRAFLDRAWLMPKYFSLNEEGVLWAIEAQFNIAAQSYSELQNDGRFRDQMRSLTAVRRVHGWLGYFWWEFYQDLKANITVRFCQHCGQVIRGGHADRQYCHRKENPPCYRERNAQQQKKSRRRVQQKGALSAGVDDQH